MDKEQEKEVTPEETVAKAGEVFGNQPNAQGYIDNQFYIRDLMSTYLNRIVDGDQKQVDRERAKFVTFSRGIIADIQAENPQAQITRVGEYTYKGVFDLAYEALHPEPVKEPEPEPKIEDEPEPPTAEPKGQATAPPRRIPGDIQPVEDGKELEGYVEKLGLKEYAEARKDFRTMTKTIKTDGSNKDWMENRLLKMKEDRV